jgi:hypothetical protein
MSIVDRRHWITYLNGKAKGEKQKEQKNKWRNK